MLCQRSRVGGKQRQSAAGPPGIALVLTILLVSLLLVMGMTLINLAGSDYQVASNESKSIQALYNADAGTEESKMRLSPSAPSADKIPVGAAATWRAYILSGHTQSEIAGDCAASTPGLDSAYNCSDASNYVFYNTVQTGSSAIPWGWLRIEKKKDGSGNPLYVDSMNVTAETTVASVTDACGQTYQNKFILLVTSEGIQGFVRRMVQMELRPDVAAPVSTCIVVDPFASGAHGKNNVEIAGNVVTDSYDSRNGAYGATNKGNNGDVSTDATSAGAITVDANATVKGDAKAGPGADLATAIVEGTPNSIKGDKTTETSVMPMPLSAIPSGITNLGDLKLSGKGSMTLTTGTYWFSSISITGNGQLTISGDVKIYVTGSIDAGGNGIVNPNGTPPSLLLYGTVDPTNPANKCTDVKIHGNGAFAGAVYAPAASIDVVGNGEVYGALTGNTVKFTGSGHGGFHYDEALGNFGQFIIPSSGGGTFDKYSRHSWREIPF